MNVLLDPERLLAMLTLEARKTFLTFDFLLTLAEEVVIGVLEALNGVLKRLASCFFQPRKLLFQDRQLQLIGLTTQTFACSFVGADTLTEEVVENPATAPEVLVEKHILFWRRFQPELVSVEPFQFTPCMWSCCGVSN